MDGLPPAEAPAIQDTPVVIERCINEAAQEYKLHPLLIRAILNVEGGKVGTMSKNRNGTYDLGPMQINTIWLEPLSKYNIGWEDLAYNACVNIHVGSWILANELKGQDDFWVGVGAYHSKTPKHNKRYRRLVYNELQDLMSSIDAKLDEKYR